MLHLPIFRNILMKLVTKNLDLAHMGDGEGIEATLHSHIAKRHDSCRLEYHKSKLSRAKTCKASVEEGILESQQIA